jgi:hypothetical protein
MTRALPWWLAPLAAALLAGCGGSTSVEEGGPARTDSRAAAVAQLGDLALGWSTDFRRHTVPLSEFMAGGPGKDGIPAIDRPRFVRASVTQYLEPQEPVIELVVNGKARAYPLQILTWHEIVNDRVAGVPVAVTFCPLCNTAIVFDRRVGGRTLDFGVSGNLRHSDLVMFDRQTESWWQQFGGAGVVGVYAGTRLRQLPTRIVSWSSFRRRHPDGLVLTRDTGFLGRPYGQNPYPGYDKIDEPPFFPAAHGDDKRLLPKERVVYVELGGEAIAVPFSALAKRREIRTEVAGRRLVIRFEGKAASALDSYDVAAGREVGTAVVVDERGEAVPFDEPFWFAVAAFRPNVVIIR